MQEIEVTAFPLIGQTNRFLGGIAIFWETQNGNFIQTPSSCYEDYGIPNKPENFAFSSYCVRRLIRIKSTPQKDLIIYFLNEELI
jgi:hypothetical protein